MLQKEKPTTSQQTDWDLTEEKESLSKNMDFNGDIPSHIDGERAGQEINRLDGSDTDQSESVESPDVPESELTEQVELVEPIENASADGQAIELYNGLDLIGIITKAISEKLGEDILIFDTREGSILMDFMIIASARNLRQNHSLVENVEDRLFEAGYKGPWHVEGNENSGWVLIDLGDIIVNLFTREERENYSLERLYQDCKSRRVE